MDVTHIKQLVDKVLLQTDTTSSPEVTYSLDFFLPLLEKMRSEGAVVLIKWDGERGKGDAGPYTALVSGATLGDQFFRTDAASMEDAIAQIIVHYARLRWGFTE